MKTKSFRAGEEFPETVTWNGTSSLGSEEKEIEGESARAEAVKQRARTNMAAPAANTTDRLIPLPNAPTGVLLALDGPGRVQNLRVRIVQADPPRPKSKSGAITGGRSRAPGSE